MSERNMTFLAWGVSAALVLVGVWVRFFPDEQPGASCAACPPARVIVAVVHKSATATATDSLDVFRLDCGPARPGELAFPDVHALDPESPPP